LAFQLLVCGFVRERRGSVRGEIAVPACAALCITPCFDFDA
jgi:hypothetical protein